ncbi:MAG: hypothetical protein ACRECY_17335 [Phyllobacterium sp.]
MRYRLKTFCPSKTVHSRIANALWVEHGGAPWDMPPDWEPDEDWVAELNLDLIPNLGPLSVSILRGWLAANGRGENEDPPHES